MTDADPLAPARACVDLLRGRGETVAVAESLTAGLITAAIADVPGASDVLRGGLAAYATEVKSSVLGVDPALIDREGVVSAACADAMAARARILFAADWAVAATGVAGPTEQDGVPVGTVHVAVRGPVGGGVELLRLDGDRARVRQATAAAAVRLLHEWLRR